MVETLSSDHGNQAPQIIQPIPDTELKVGFVGLGAMGLTMAKHVMASGRAVVGWDRDAAAVASLQAAGGIAAVDLAEVAACSLIISIVFDDEATREVTLAPGGLRDNMAADAIHVVMATISPTLSRELSEAHAAMGQRYVAASVFGRPEAAAAGKLLINCSGSTAVFKTAEPVLCSFGTPRLIGAEPEQAMLLKIMGNNMIYSAAEAVREMFVFLRASGIKDIDAKEVIIDSFFPGPIYHLYAQRWMGQWVERTEVHPIAKKDNGLCLEAAEQMGVEMPFVRFLHDKIFQ